jgi:hypothetical protein
MQAQEPLAVPWKPLPLDGILDLLGVVTVNGLRTKLSPEMRAFVRSRGRLKQFREPVIGCVIHNIETLLAISHVRWRTSSI